MNIESLIWKLVKFSLVGLSGMAIDFGSTWILKERVKINKYFANATGFVLAATSNYLWNRVWTFQSHSMRISREYLTFIAISVIGLGLNYIVVFLLTERVKLNFYFSKLFAVGVVTLWNFSMNYLITFG